MTRGGSTDPYEANLAIFAFSQLNKILFSTFLTVKNQKRGNSQIGLKGYGGRGGSRVKNISWAYFIEFFLTISTLFVPSKNSKYFPRNRVRRATKMAIFKPKNGLKLIKINENRALKLIKSSNIGYASVSIYTPPETRLMT